MSSKRTPRICCFPKVCSAFSTKFHISKAKSENNQLLDFTEISDRFVDPFDTSVCDKCKVVLREPFIRCADCSEWFCLPCFASGAETKRHRSDHRYSISRADFNIFPKTSWTANEEKEFLNLIEVQGVGNWEDIGAKMKKSADECRSHFHTFYFDGVFSKLGMTNENSYVRHNVPYLFKSNSLDPPRGENGNSLAGYRFARSDFETPMDHSAESILNNVSIEAQSKDVEMKSIMEAINCAMVRAYNHRLKERNRCYKVVKSHGLILQQKTRAWLTRYSEVFGQQSRLDRFITFMQISDPTSFDFLLESMKLYAEKKKILLR